MIKTLSIFGTRPEATAAGTVRLVGADRAYCCRGDIIHSLSVLDYLRHNEAAVAPLFYI